MEKANRFSGKLRVTGVGSVICARHQFVLPNAVGDMQKGERYVSLTSGAEPHTDQS
jgi:hypothetical protein